MVVNKQYNEIADMNRYKKILLLGVKLFSILLMLLMLNGIFKVVTIKSSYGLILIAISVLFLFEALTTLFITGNRKKSSGTDEYKHRKIMLLLTNLFSTLLILTVLNNVMEVIAIKDGKGLILMLFSFTFVLFLFDSTLLYRKRKKSRKKLL